MADLEVHPELSGTAGHPRVNRAVENHDRAHVAASAAPILAILLMCACAFAMNYHVTRDLEWPGRDVEFREMASAQTLLDEGAGHDSTYRGESAWYSPLTAWVLAGTSRALNVPLRTVTPRIGPYLNLLAPLGFTLAVWTVLGRWTAVAALAAFLFLGSPRLEDYESATYSPWLLPNNYVQGLFYLGVIACARMDPLLSRWRTGLGLGLLLGLVFYGHLAPAMILGGMIVALAAWRGWHDARYAERLGFVLVVLSAAGAVVAPFVWRLAWHYRFQTLNPFPALSPYTRLDLNEAIALARDLATFPELLGITGLALHIFSRQRGRIAPVVGVWLLVSGGLLLYNYATFLTRKVGLVLPTVVPAFHFLFYFQALVSLGVGVAVVGAANALAVVARTRLAMSARIARPSTFVVALTAALVATHIPSYLALGQFGPQRAHTLMLGQHLSAPLWHWLRANTQASDVFLCPDHLSLFVVTPAGRKVVATNRYFSTPFVDWARRDRDRDAMIRALQDHDPVAFRALATHYGVAYIMWSDSVPDEVLRAAGMRGMPTLRGADITAAGFPKVFEEHGIAVFRVGGLERGSSPARLDAARLEHDQ
jgi:hypothetical protein